MRTLKVLYLICAVLICNLYEAKGEDGKVDRSAGDESIVEDNRLVGFDVDPVGPVEPELHPWKEMQMQLYCDNLQDRNLLDRCDKCSVLMERKDKKCTVSLSYKRWVLCMTCGQNLINKLRTFGEAVRDLDSWNVGDLNSWHIPLDGKELPTIFQELWVHKVKQNSID